MLRMLRVGKKYKVDKKTFWALRGINLEIAEGEIIGITGPNGSGKSTLLKLLAGITKPTEGTIDCKGRIGALLEVGTGFHHELTGKENIYLSGAILGMSKREVKHHFDQIIDFSEIEPFLNTPVKRYSSGMLLRLGFSIMVHLRAETLIIDEILAVGDLNFQEKCFEKIHTLANSGRTILFVSHDETKIDRLCNRTIEMKEGSVYEHKALLQ